MIVRRGAGETVRSIEPRSSGTVPAAITIPNCSFPPLEIQRYPIVSSVHKSRFLSLERRRYCSSRAFKMGEAPQIVGVRFRTPQFAQTESSHPSTFIIGVEHRTKCRRRCKYRVTLLCDGRPLASGVKIPAYFPKTKRAGCPRVPERM